MPSNHELEIIMKLKDEISQKLAGVEGAFRKLSNSTRDLALEMRKTGREMSYVGMSMAAVGTAITAPLALAYKTAGNFNAEIARQLRQTQNVFNNLSVSIGKSLLPVMRQLTDSVANAVGWWNSLEQVTRDKIIQNIWNLGKSLIALGVSLVVIGKTLSTLANLGLLIANFEKLWPLIAAVVSPLGLAALGFTALSAAMLKWKPIADGVIRTFAALTSVLTGGLVNIKPEAMIAGFDNARQKLIDLDNLRKEIMGSLTGKGKGAESVAGGFWSGFELAATAAMDKLRDFQQLGIDVANQLTTNLASAFSSFINDAFSGQLKRAQDYFAEFGKSILNMFAQIIGKMAAEWLAFQALLAGRAMIGNILGIFSSASSLGHGFSAAPTNTGSGLTNAFNTTQFNPAAGLKLGTFHTGGIVRAHNGLAIDEVPIIAQTGERVLSRSQNAEYEKGRGGAQAVLVIKAWDFADIAKHENQIVAMMAKAISRNGALRGTIKKYG